MTRSFAQAYGIEKSATSERFIQASREKLKQLMERPLGDLRRCAVLVDGTPFKDRQMIVALGIGCDGRKTVLGLRDPKVNAQIRQSNRDFGAGRTRPASRPA